MSPFDITSKMLGPYLFSSTSRETLGDKIELYFHDYSFIPLFIQVRSRRFLYLSVVLPLNPEQENYLRTQPAGARDYSGPEKLTKVLELMDKAASSISDGDLVDALIHG
jgi:replication factor C subunit 1